MQDSPHSTGQDRSSRRLGRNVYALAAVSFFTDVSSEMIYPLLPVFLSTVLGANAGFIGAIEGAAESTAALLKLASGWWSDRVRRRKPLVVAGYALASAMRPLIAIAQSATQVLVIRVSDRVGKGIRNSPRDALIADSVSPEVRGRAFGLRSAADNAGALLGPLIAFGVLATWHVSLRTVFWFAVIPGAIAVIVAIVGIREVPHHGAIVKETALQGAMGRRFWVFLIIIFIFTLGNSTDAFLLLRARQLGVPVALAPILWALLHGVKSVLNIPGGVLSDRIGRRPILIACAVAALATAYPALSWLVSAPSFSRLLTVELWLAFLYAAYNGAMAVYLTEIMPVEVRTSGFSVAYSLATALFGGFTPAISTYLIHVTGNPAMPGVWLSFAAACGLSAVLELSTQRARSLKSPL